MLADYQTLVDDLVRDQSGVIEPAARDRAIAGAVTQYAVAQPRVLRATVEWRVTGVFGPVPAGWKDGMRVLNAQYPTGQARFVAAIVTGGGFALECSERLPAGALVQVDYTAPHTVTADEDTIPEIHRAPVAMLAASMLCQQLATYYSAQRETLIGADASSTETRAREFAARAREYRSAYYIGTGQADPYKSGATGGVAAAMAVGNWPARRRRDPAREVR